MTIRTDGIAVALAWPETLCKQAGAWYDRLMYWFGINQSGYYKVGHAAIVLVDPTTGSCHYFDFGRYHAPHGFGRVRNSRTDHDLAIKTNPLIDGNTIVNLEDILIELLGNVSSHGSGTVFGSQVPINFEKAYRMATTLQDRDFISYGPFKAGGTNCSRFVNKVLNAGCVGIRLKIALQLPWMLTPTPMWNLMALRSEIVSVKQDQSANIDQILQPETKLHI